jgi:hypothetical protein
MTSEEVIGVLRRVDWAKGTMVILSKGLRTTELSFDLTPQTPDYRGFIGQDVKCVVEDGWVKSLTALR